MNAQRRPEDLERLLNQVLTRNEEFRALLAREMHNELGALLTGMSLDLSGLRSLGGAGDSEFAAALDSSRALLREAVVLKRRFIEQLYPSTLELLGLGSAVESLARGFGAAYGLDVEVAAEEVATASGSGLGIDIYRVAEAAMENVVRHASARLLRVALGEADNWLVLVVSDDGAGFDSSAADHSSGFELMRHRLGRWRGRVEIQSAPGEGTAITARAPLPRPAP